MFKNFNKNFKAKRLLQIVQLLLLFIVQLEYLNEL